jgi:polar amino acid transport system substrate-binding protein
VAALIRLASTLVFVLAGSAAAGAQTAGPRSTAPAPAAKILRWAGDAEGGAPYVEADAADPSRVIGFDVEVADLIAAGLGRSSKLPSRRSINRLAAATPTSA